MKPKVIFLDWNGTLTNDVYWGHLSDPTHHHHGYHKLFRDWLFKANKDTFSRWVKGEYTAEAISRMMADELKVDVEIVFNELVYSCQQMKLSHPDIPDVVQKLRKKGIAVVIATNSADTFRRFTIPAMNLESLFDDFLISYERHAKKFEDEEGMRIFFDEYMHKNAISYNESLLIDDHGTHPIYQKFNFKIAHINSGAKLVEELGRYLLLS